MTGASARAGKAGRSPRCLRSSLNSPCPGSVLAPSAPSPPMSRDGRLQRVDTAAAVGEGGQLRAQPALRVRRGGVTIAAGMLQKAGHIRYDRGQVAVTDRDGLEAAA